MTSPFRLAPPRNHALALVDRPRLLESILTRYERRLTALRAGAGFGKTALLMQGLEAAETEAGGIDIWLSCGPQDDRQEEIAAVLLDAFGVTGPISDPVASLCDAMWKQSPREVALFLDDVHFLESGGSAAGFLERLLAEMPANGHLVIASRASPPFPIARLVSQGEALLLDEADLAFSTDERARFFALRGAEPNRSANAAPAWPAILELWLGSHAEQVGDYLLEEVLGRVGDETKRNLARMNVLDWIDKDRIEAFTGKVGDPRELFGELPLTTFDANGAARIHGLWTPLIENLDPAWTSDEKSAAREALISRGFYREAALFCHSTADPSSCLEIVQHLVQNDWAGIEPAEFQTLLGLLPADVAESSIGRLAAALLQVRLNPSRARAKLEAALDGLRAEGNIPGEISGGFALGNLDFWSGNIPGLEFAAKRAREINLPVIGNIAEANVRLLEGRPDQALELLDRSQAAGLGSDFLILNLTMALLDLGEPARAIAESEPFLDASGALFEGALRSIHSDAIWLTGKSGLKDISVWDDGFGIEVAGHLHSAVTFLSLLSFQNAVLGRDRVSRRHLSRARELFDPSFGERAESAMIFARVAQLCAAGEESDAESLIEDCLDRFDPMCLPQRHTFRGLALAIIVSPRIREISRGWNIGRCYEEGLAAARAIISAREDSDLTPANSVEWERRKGFSPFFVPRLMLELAVVCVAAGQSEAVPFAEELARSERPALRELTNHVNKAVAEEATALLGRVPEQPKEMLDLRVLGPLTLRRAGIEVESSALRRGRVRDILQYLVAHRTVRRTELATVLWPDLAGDAPLNNLRVNLAHVHKLLEPDRRRGEPAFFLRQHGDQLSLHRGDGLMIDVDEFAAQIAAGESAEAAGAFVLALERYERALELYRGSYLIDAREPRWGEADRMKHESDFLRIAIRSAELELGRAKFDRALRFADAALAVDDLAEAAHRVRALIFLRRRNLTSARSSIRATLELFSNESIEPERETRDLARRLGVEAS